ncbi:hypothetical protein A3K69_04670 [Candidatus Bathyarchaeota archaeon RBG_16_57_9]|nr:MAG: hypothetical protein A3K69_04670 [Candidatus Bathyarchaeota archaeon RBG_16_57_9]
MAEILKNRQLQIIVMLLSFLFVFLPYFLNVPQLNTASTKLITITSIVTAFTVALAVLAQFRRGINIINRRSRGWYFKAYMLMTLVLMLGFSLISRETGPYHWVMFAVVNPLSSVNYGILAFYMASTAARAFRARNTKALLLLLSGFIVLIYQAPLTGAYFTGFEPIALYLGSTFGLAAGRMFLISVTVGAIVFGVRVIMGNEPSVLGLSKEE